MVLKEKAMDKTYINKDYIMYFKIIKQDDELIIWRSFKKRNWSMVISIKNNKITNV